MATFIVWKETVQVHTGWVYVGEGITRATWKTEVSETWCRYSNESTDAVIAKAHAFVASDRPDARVVVKEE